MIRTIVDEDRKRCQFMSRKATKKKKVQKKNTNDSWMFAMLLSVFCILAVSLKTYQFHLMNTSLSFSVFVIPILVFISNYITKKYGFSDSFKSILIASLIVVAFLILIQDLTNRKLILLDIILPFIIYFISLFLNLAIYYYNLINMDEHKLLTYFNYIFTLMIYYLLYLLYSHNYIITNSFWKEYFISIIIGGILSFGAIYIDSKIVRGIPKNKKVS